MKKLIISAFAIVAILMVQTAAFAANGITELKISVTGNEDKDILFEDSGSSLNPEGYRFSDEDHFFVYKLDLDDAVTSASLKLEMSNEYAISLSADNATWKEALKVDSKKANFENRGFSDVDVTPYLANNDSKTIYLKMNDAYQEDGWGGLLYSLELTTSSDVAGGASTDDGATTTTTEPVVEANPKTGDVGMSLYIVLAILSAAVLTFVVIRKKTQHN